jgi:hypothetical protein
MERCLRRGEPVRLRGGEAKRVRRLPGRQFGENPKGLRCWVLVRVGRGVERGEDVVAGAFGAVVPAFERG